MAGAIVGNGRILHIPEILEQGLILNGDSVRVYGKLIQYECAQKFVVIEYNEQKLKIIIEDCPTMVPWNLQSCYQFIGELDFGSKDPILRARVARNVDGLDIKLYNEALELCRKYIK